MAVNVLVGLQWGDEGKGKIVDVLTPQMDAVCRFQGGPNAGHTLEFNNKKYVLHTIPSGIFREDVVNIIGNGVVIDPVIFQEEVEKLEASDKNIRERLFISKRATLIMPTHRILDAANEAAKGKNKIGSTLKGIGPTYTDKVSRNALRVGDVVGEYMDKYNRAKQRHLDILDKLHQFEYDLKEYEGKWHKAVEFLNSFKLIDTEHLINNMLKENKEILAEGAQGSLLDIDFGTYPFVTSSSTLSSGACTGLGIAPSKVKEVTGIFKAYCTRVGMGPFTTELECETGERIRQEGHEFGATTGRNRRCGWLDLVALNYTIMLNGVTQLAMMKADVLNEFDTVKVAVGYEIDGKITKEFPYELTDEVKPVYKEFPGWKIDVDGVLKTGKLPKELKEYIAFIEDETGVKIKILSLGPDRKATLNL
ncbi:adenylosuccinate synthetase [Balneicella halophila]|uniref:Adenylosuccinate synthetase n=1 Tax=Balneicella halophila TaxID=1537566 RepID=A0A7L4UPW5_BALHA|nr:adenylosuccinate synthase [Balneicella halophila]PVX50083.1 adenylosuccinate synthetase [Balneicella halophila]